MKFRVTFTTPDAVGYALELIGEPATGELDEFVGRWVRYHESITVEFDTDAGTCVVVEVGE